MSDVDDITSKSAPARTRPNWDDYLAVTAEYQRIIRRADKFATFGLLGGLATGALALTLAEAVGLPPSLGPWLLAFEWAAAFALSGALWRWQRNALTKHQARCRTCHTAIVKPTMARSDVSRAALAVATGRCPRCGGACESNAPPVV